MITRENYEVFIIDYLDGNLNPGLVEELHRFLHLNPDIAEEFEGLSSVTLIPKNTEFDGKELLKKKSFSRHGIESEADYLLIAELEGDISDEEKKLLSNLQNEKPSLQSEKILFSKTKLQANLNEKFDFKARLKRTPVVKIRQQSVRFALSIAASLLIFVGIFAWVNTRLVTNQSFVAQSPEQKPQEVIQGKVEVKQNGNQEVPSANQENQEPIVTGQTESPSKEEAFFEEKNPLPSITETQTEANTSKEVIVFERVEPIDINKVQLAQNTPTVEIVIPQASRTIIPTINPSQKVKNSPNQGSLKEVGLFDIVQMGIDKFAEATGTNLKLEGKKNEEGKLVKVEFDSKLFALSTSVRKK